MGDSPSTTTSVPDCIRRPGPKNDSAGGVLPAPVNSCEFAEDHHRDGSVFWYRTWDCQNAFCMTSDLYN